MTGCIAVGTSVSGWRMSSGCMCRGAALDFDARCNLFGRCVLLTWTSRNVGVLGGCGSVVLGVPVFGRVIVVGGVRAVFILFA